ncbi:MAG TPA: tetratricopeptide repeat protein [Streptosporangiaceae bacterium]|nr:tetratricopeptide repeat protein [Streptosporangiaceae bacterium]
MSGTVPFVAEPYTRRSETGQGPWDALRPGLTVILGPDSDRAAMVAARGGTGKTRLAAEFAARLWAAAELDLLVWLDAGSRDSIVTGYASALAAIRVAAPAGKPEAAAAQFLTWLADTRRRWLVVLDDLAEPADAEGLWPQGPSGQAIVTTCTPGVSPSPIPAATNGNGARAADPVSIGISAFSPREALDFLSDRLNDDPYRSAGALDLAMALDCLPAAMALAVTYMLDTWQDCRQYRLALERHRRPAAGEARTDPLAASWMLAVERAMEFAPTELPWPALRLAAVLGPSWIPGAVLTSAAACAYVTGRKDVTQAEQASVRTTFGNLQQVGLVTIEPADDAHTVHMAAALRSSILQVMGAAEIRRTVQAAADALCESWPERGSQPELEQALRHCGNSVRRCDDQALWSQGSHPLLVRIGQNLDDAGLAETAFIYWRDLATRCGGALGARSPVTLQVREGLADAAMAAARIEEAVGLRERLAADLDEVAGPAHPQAIASRASLAVALRRAGRLSEAILLGNRIAADSDRVFGTAHPQTTAILLELGTAHYEAGHNAKAIDAFERCLSLRAQSLGLMYPDTLAARHKVAEAYRRAGRGKDAIALYQDVLAQYEKAATRPARADAVIARENLAIAYYRAGMTDEAVTTLERVIAEWRRVPEGDAASTLKARANLAAICCLSGRLREAIRFYESELEDLERLRGPEHPDFLRARWNLAAAYHKARRLPEAVELGEATVAGCERVLGPGHRETLASRANLAHAYHASGMLKRASAHFDRALRDCERALEPGDPLTEEVRALRVRYLSGRQGAAPIISPPADLWRSRPGRASGTVPVAGPPTAGRRRPARHPASRRPPRPERAP